MPALPVSRPKNLPPTRPGNSFAESRNQPCPHPLRQAGTRSRGYRKPHRHRPGNSPSQRPHRHRAPLLHCGQRRTRQGTCQLSKIPTKSPHRIRLTSTARRPYVQAFTLVRGQITGSRDRTRTYNLPVNSRLLCQLSYTGPSHTTHRKSAPMRCCDKSLAHFRRARCTQTAPPAPPPPPADTRGDAGCDQTPAARGSYPGRASAAQVLVSRKA
jgi:hypothetical protein